MADLYAAGELGTDSAAGQMASPLEELHARWAQAGGERSLGGSDLGCVLPLPRIGMWPWQVCPMPRWSFCFALAAPILMSYLAVQEVKMPDKQLVVYIRNCLACICSGFLINGQET